MRWEKLDVFQNLKSNENGVFVHNEAINTMKMRDIVSVFANSSSASYVQAQLNLKGDC